MSQMKEEYQNAIEKQMEIEELKLQIKLLTKELQEVQYQWISKVNKNRYNGWHNYATWWMNINFFDDPYSILEDFDGSIYELSEYLKSYVDDYIDMFREEHSAVIIEMAECFMDDANWYELAEHYYADLDLEKED